MSRARSISPTKRLRPEELAVLRKKQEEQEEKECKGGICRRAFNALGNKALGAASFMGNKALGAVSALGTKGNVMLRNYMYPEPPKQIYQPMLPTPEDLTDDKESAAVRTPLPHVRMYAQPSEYDVKMSDLQQDLAKIREKLDAAKFGLARNLEDGSNPGRLGIIEADELSKYITSGRANVERLKQQEKSITEQISRHATMKRGGKSKRSKRSKQSKRSKRVSSKRGLTKRRKN